MPLIFAILFIAILMIPLGEPPADYRPKQKQQQKQENVNSESNNDKNDKND